MNATIKQLIKSGINMVMKIAARTSVGSYILEQAASRAMSRTQSVLHQGIELKFVAPNYINRFRIDTFSTKEPETLEWIDEIPHGSVFWDIGANIGLYTCYAAKAKGCRVFAFEPSVFNLELLARNIFLNGFAEQVTIVPLPLSEALASSTLNMESMEWGAAKSTFDQSYGQDGQTLNKIFEFQTIGISMKDAVESLQIPQPDYIKMDVDGIEHLILKGGAPILRKVKGMLIEINEEFEKQFVNSALYLGKAGLVLKEKRQADMFKDGPYRNRYNQIWHRK